VIPPAPLANASPAKSSALPDALAETLAALGSVHEPNQQARSGNDSGKRSGSRNSKRINRVALPERRRKKAARKPEFYTVVSDQDLAKLIADDRVRVERSGSRRQNDDGTQRDYRGKYVALRERSKLRRVLAFGLTEQMSQYLANRLNVHYCQNCLTVSVDHCQNCDA